MVGARFVCVVTGAPSVVVVIVLLYLKIAIVYTCVRFSAPRHATGHNIQRQTEFTENWVKLHNLRWDGSLTVNDAGLNAFRQKQVKNGAPGVFATAAEADNAQPVSNWLTRHTISCLAPKRETRRGQAPRIVSARLTVVTLEPYRRLFAIWHHDLCRWAKSALRFSWRATPRAPCRG